MFRRRFATRRSRQSGLFWLLLFFGVTIFAFAFLERSVVPTLVALAESEASGTANRLVVDTVRNEILPLIEGVSLIDFVTGPSGEVVFVRVNSPYLSQVEAMSLRALQDGLARIEAFQVYVPLGQLFGSKILATAGPRIPVKLIPVGVVSTKVDDSFEVAGINQTKYTLFLIAKVSIKVVIPLVSSSTIVSAEVPLATVLIPGRVPDTYLSIPVPGNAGQTPAPQR